MKVILNNERKAVQVPQDLYNQLIEAREQGYCSCYIRDAENKPHCISLEEIQ